MNPRFSIRRAVSHSKRVRQLPAAVIRWVRGLSGRQLIALGAVVVVAAVALTGLARLKTDTAVASFLPTGDPVLESTQRAAQAFGGDPIIVLAESAQPRALLTEDQLPRLLALENQLSKLPDVAVVYGPGTVLNQIAGAAQDLMGVISLHRDALQANARTEAEARHASPQEVDQAVKDSTREYDLRYGSLLVQGLPGGLPTLHNPDFVNAIVFDQSGTPRAEWRFVIPRPNALAVLVRPREDLDQAGTERLVDGVRSAAEKAGLNTSRLTVSGSPSVVAGLGEAVQTELPLLGGIALVLVTTCYVMLPWTRRRRRRWLPIIVTLSSTLLTLSVFGLSGRPVSLGVIAFLPIVIGIGSDFPAYLIHGGAPGRRVVVVALASALGFAALALSPLPFVRDLGLAIATGVLMAVAVAFAMRSILSRDTEPEIQPAARESRPLSRTSKLGVLVAGTLVAALGWIALPHIKIDAQPEKLAAGLPAVTDVQHAENVIGSSGEVDIVLSGKDVANPQALAWMRAAQEAVLAPYGDKLRPIVSMSSLLAFLGDNPTKDQMDAALALLPHYLLTSVLSNDHTQAQMSLGLSLQDLGQQSALLASVRRVLPPPPPGMSADLVGLPVAAARGFDLVSQGRYLTNLAGIVAAGLVLLIGLSWRRVAGMAVLAAVLATGWGLAGTWLLGVPLNPLSVALGSLTTATACEFTVLLSYARRRGTGTLGRTVSVAALAALLGYLALTASQLSVIRNFGLLLAFSVGLSLLAAQLVVHLFARTGGARTEEGATTAEPDKSATFA
jgi:hypothetical protein